MGLGGGWDGAKRRLGGGRDGAKRGLGDSGRQRSGSALQRGKAAEEAAKRILSKSWGPQWSLAAIIHFQVFGGQKRA